MSPEVGGIASLHISLTSAGFNQTSSQWVRPYETPFSLGELQPSASVVEERVNHRFQHSNARYLLKILHGRIGSCLALPKFFVCVNTNQSLYFWWIGLTGPVSTKRDTFHDCFVLWSIIPLSITNPLSQTSSRISASSLIYLRSARIQQK